jgi:hypothetical protein
VRNSTVRIVERGIPLPDVLMVAVARELDLDVAVMSVETPTVSDPNSGDRNR